MELGIGAALHGSIQTLAIDNSGLCLGIVLVIMLFDTEGVSYQIYCPLHVVVPLICHLGRIRRKRSNIIICIETLILRKTSDNLLKLIAWFKLIIAVSSIIVTDYEELQSENIVLELSTAALR
jgi:hypothetical protein